MFDLKKNEIKFIYNGNKLEDMEAYAYVLTLHKHKINELDVAKNDMTPTQVLELASKLNKRVIDLFDEKSTYFKANIQGEDMDETDLLTVLIKDKSTLKTPILISANGASVLEYPRDTIKVDMVFNEINGKDS